MRGERGVSSVLGVVLIVGMTAAMVVSLMMIGTVALQTSQENAELARMETSMAQMSSKASLSALGGAGSQQFDVGAMRDGSLEVRPDTGSIRIVSVEGDKNLSEANNTTVIYETDAFGALVYTQGEHEVAYQGGGVWTRTGDRGGQMVSPPEYHYLDETLTFPIIRTAGSGNEGGTGSGSVTHQSSQSFFPNETMTNPVDNQTIFVEIESDYHRGWYNFFDSRSDGLLEHDPANQTVTVELTAIYEESFSWAIAAQQDIEIDGQASDIESMRESQNYPSASGEVESKIADCEGDWNFTSDDGPYEGGQTYCANEENMDLGDIEFNTTGGDIDVVFDQGVRTNGDITVSGSNTVRFYVNDSVDLAKGYINPDKDPDQFYMYVHSDVDAMEEQGNPTIHAVIYAPNTDVIFSGNVDFEGAIIADSFEASGNPTVNYYDQLADSDLGFEAEVDELRYLHITENVIEIELD